VNNRFTDRRWVPGLAAGLGLIPPPIRARARFAVFQGDPLFAGLHASEATEKHQRSYRVTPHVCYPSHLNGRPRAERLLTLVLTGFDDYHGSPFVAVHEFGHLLDYSTGLSHAAVAYCDYAATSRDEAYASAFTQWVWERNPLPRAADQWQDSGGLDQSDRWYFDWLAVA